MARREAVGDIEQPAFDHPLPLGLRRGHEFIARNDLGWDRQAGAKLFRARKAFSPIPPHTHFAFFLCSYRGQSGTPTSDIEARLPAGTETSPRLDS